ncbi:MAG: DUF1016 family protein [Bacilli bacterium]|nr:DUF1016 family protein [Bacilli bacterium]
MINYYNEIKERLIDNEINKKVKEYSINKGLLDSYYFIGKMLFEAGKHYGEGIINEYSTKLTKDLNSKFNTTLLKRIRKFYLLIKKGAPLAHQLSWSHYVELLPLNNIDEIKYYIMLVIKNNVSRNQLRIRIKNQEFKRLPNNTKIKIKQHEDINISDFIKNPIIIKNRHKSIYSEKILQKVIVDNIKDFMNELGEGYSYIDNEYKIKIGDRYNYIDLLLFNYKFNCFVVIELKTVELKKEHIGQIEVYMNYIDKNVKEINHDKTIGIIICKKNNKYVIEYTSDKKIISREYMII